MIFIVPIMRTIKAIIVLIITLLFFPATVGALLLFEKFKQEAYLKNSKSALDKVMATAKVWVGIGVIIDIVKLYILFSFLKS
jgi:hypothetical protein